MLTIICGEDSSSSRKYYSDLKKEYLLKQYEIFDINFSQIENIPLWLGESESLFSKKKVFFTQNLNKKISKKTSLKLLKIISDIEKSEQIELVDWEEEITSRYLKFGNNSKIKEFKPNQSIFKLQDSLYPGNLTNFLKILSELPDSVEGLFIFIMISRHLRNLLIIANGGTIPKMFSWQLAKLNSQAKKWDKEKLLAFYLSLHKIDLLIKTSKNPFSVKKSLDILACYFL